MESKDIHPSLLNPPPQKTGPKILYTTEAIPGLKQSLKSSLEVVD